MENSFKPFYSSTGISTDTRKIESGCLFVCIKGENFDGNTFAEKALEQGASHVIVDNPDFYAENGKMTLVNDSISYLQQLANYHRRQFNIPVIGITGSNGKTTSKELIHAVLSKKYKVLATIGNLNNHIGVPLTILRLDASHEIAIIEMGANRFKDIEELCTIAEPTYGIITNIGKAHLEGFLSFEGVLKTKKELYDSVENSKGTLVFNADDSVLVNILPSSTRNLSYGSVSESASIKGELVRLSPFVEMKWNHGDYYSPLVKTQLVGKYNFYNFLAAASFGVLFKVSGDLISLALSEYTPTNNRSQVTKTERNTLIMDCYNANPTSMKSAVESFAAIEHPNKLMILGDMAELGKETETEHRAIIHLAESLNLSCIVVGKFFGSIDSSSIQRKFDTSQELFAFLQENPQVDQLFLIKGSRSTGLEILAGAL